MDRHGNKPIPLTEGLGDFMKRLIILLSVIITILCGCGNTDENKVKKGEMSNEEFFEKYPYLK